MPKKQDMVIANPLSGYTKLDGGWDNSTTHQPDTIDRKGRLGDGYDTPEERDARTQKAREGKVLTNSDL
jgi:hypothetical protein